MTRSFARHRKTIRLATLVGLALAALVGLGLNIYFIVATRDLPSVDDIPAHLSVPSSYIYDREGRVLYEIVDPDAGKHVPISLEDIPLNMQHAVIATEDSTFYHNPGFSPRGILRSLWLNIRSGRVVAGGSTITQQLIRNLLFSLDERYEQTLERKVREATLAVRLSMRYSKDEILALYLNQTYFGNFAYGVQAAAQAYFGLPAAELDLAQSALLAGLIQSPPMYNPYLHLEAAKERQRVVLELMERRGYITPQQVELAAREPLHFAASPFPIEAPHFSMYVANILERDLGLERMRQGGLRVHTTLDLDMQRTAEAIVTRRLAQLNEEDESGMKRRVDGAALVAQDPQTGEILAMVGSPDYFDARANGAVNAALAPRQPGSALKPFTYALAFERGYTPATMLLDVRTTFITSEGLPYVPQNYDLLYHGPVLAREALASSFNVPAVKVLDYVGVDQLADLTSQLGITTFKGAERYGLSLTLGGGEVRLLDLTTAYSALAAQGRRVEPMAIRWVENEDGQRLREWKGGPSKQVISPQVAYLITDILSDDRSRISGFGEGSVLQLSRPAAAKTGTTTDWRDNWTLGYTPDLVAGVWVGNADNSPMYGVSGVSGAGPIWRDFMEQVLRGRPVREFERPDGLIQVQVCSDSGLLPGPDCPRRRQELFIAGTEPTQECDLHQRVAIDMATGELATEETPPERILERVYLVLPDEARAWALEQGIPQPPVAASQLAAADVGTSTTVAGALVLTSPDPGTIYRLNPSLPRSSQRIEIAAQAGRGMHYDVVELYVDGALLGQLFSAPYARRWELEPGTHRLSARGRTPDGEWVESDPIEITVRE